MPIVGSMGRRAGEASEPTSSCHASLQMKRSVMCQCESTCTAAAARATQKQSGNNRAQNNQWLHDAVPHSHSHSQCSPLPSIPTLIPMPIPIAIANPIAISILIPHRALTVIVINLASSAQSNSLGALQTGLSLGFCSASHSSSTSPRAAAVGVGMRVQKTWQLNSSSQSNVGYSTERTVG